MCVCLVLFQNSLDFVVVVVVVISNFRGAVPAPIINGVHYFTALELEKSLELCEDSFKTPFGRYSEKR